VPETGRPGLLSPDRWKDLGSRTASGVAMLVVGVAAIAAGEIWFQMLAVFVTAVMIWELFRMIRPGGDVPAMLLAALTASVISGLLATDASTEFVLLFVPGLIGAALLPRERLTFLLYAVAIAAAGWGLVTLRDAHGATWLFWLVLVVVTTDVLGYFAGRAFGGPKFWPAISPKKTWAGTASGWVGAGLVGALFLTFTDAGRDLIWISMVLSLASQLGDIAESALKRRLGVKDSSALIPGHGGLFDRFDGVLGAAIFMMAVALVVDVPEVRP